MSAVVIIILVVAGFIVIPFIMDSIDESNKIAKEGGIYKKYKILIDNFIDPESGLKVVKETNKYVCVGKSDAAGSMAFHFQHTFSKINVTFELKNRLFGNHKLEWNFPETMPQEEMIRHIETRTRQYMDNVFARFH